MTAGRRVAVAVIAGAVTGAVLGFTVPWQIAALGAWDATAIVFIGWTWFDVGRFDGAETARFATREDSSRAASDAMLLSASVACLVAVGLALTKASSARGGLKAALITVGVLSVVVSWGVVHSVFTLRYARVHYNGDGPGIDFNGDDEPDYVDFAYVALTVGMTYQVSDTNLRSKDMRRLALRHGLLSFVFGTVIVAMTINVVAGLLK
jgi:uncharacterized membrane protein